MSVKERLELLRRDSISCGCSGCREFKRVVGYWADLIEVDYEREVAQKMTSGNADLDALEKACEEVLDGDTLKALMKAKRRIKEARREPPR